MCTFLAAALIFTAAPAPVSAFASLKMSSWGVSRLSSTEQLMYDHLVSELKRILKNGGSTKISFNDPDFKLEEIDCSDKDNVKNLWGRLITCVSNNHPELLCYQDLVSANGGSRFSYSYTGDYKVTSLNAYISVDDCFQDKSSVDPTHTLSTSTLDKLNSAEAVAKKVISENSKNGVYDTIKAYADYIADNVTYNHEAANENVKTSSSPWSLISVFDNDSNTNVVCEGYAKAFQYLMDNTARFEKAKIESKLVSSSNHMWNVVDINGKNYIVDVTWYDTDSADSPYRSEYLLGGQTTVNDDTTGNHNYETDTTDFYTSDELTLSDTAYDNSTEAALDDEDQSAANDVMDLIDAIGTVSNSVSSGDKISSARYAYNELSDTQKALVNNLTKLEDAEEKYRSYSDENYQENLNAANAVIEKIDAIGTVDLNSIDKINDADNAYKALTDDQKKLVPDSYVQTLNNAINEYASLVDDYNAAVPVMNKIIDIGTVTFSDSSKNLISAARSAYDKLTDNQKKFVTNYSTLTSAETEYQHLEDEHNKQVAEQQAREQKNQNDKNAANAVISKIDSIGKVSYSDASKNLINAARSAYNKLSTDQKKFVTNYAALTRAESEYNALAKKATTSTKAPGTTTSSTTTSGTKTPSTNTSKKSTSSTTKSSGTNSNTSTSKSVTIKKITSKGTTTKKITSKSTTKKSTTSKSNTSKAKKKKSTSSKKQINSIKKQKGKISKLSAGKKKLTIKLKKIKISGISVKYQIAIRIKGSKKWKYYYVSATSKTISKLKKKKTYSVKVRPYITIKGKKYYGKWSGTSSKKVK